MTSATSLIRETVASTLKAAHFTATKSVLDVDYPEELWTPAMHLDFLPNVWLKGARRSGRTPHNALSHYWGIPLNLRLGAAPEYE